MKNTPKMLKRFFHHNKVYHLNLLQVKKSFVYLNFAYYIFIIDTLSTMIFLVLPFCPITSISPLKPVVACWVKVNSTFCHSSLTSKALESMMFSQLSYKKILTLLSVVPASAFFTHAVMRYFPVPC